MTWETYREANRTSWDERVPIHVASEFYDVEGFLGGRSTLRFFEREELPPLEGKRLLHLQCHFGLDTLSLAREGAAVTGLDFSASALEAAAEVARRAGIEARWVQSDVYEAPEALGGERFDVVYTGGGAINWLADIRRWAQVVADCLEPGGTFYFWEFHPFPSTLDDEREDDLLLVKHPYFQPPDAPLRWEEPGTYAEPSARTEQNVTYEWNHPIGEVVTALLEAGLRLEFLHEFELCAFKRLPSMVAVEFDGRRWWRLPEGAERMPMMYALRAVKDA